MKEITPQELQEIQLQILAYIDRVCTEHHLTYFLDAGTLLGAVRHKGFIPWDDDIDLLMPRKDYEKLFQILKDDETYPMINRHNAPNYIVPFSKVYDKRTCIKEKVVDNPSYGVFVDIVPFDNLPDSALVRYVYQTRMKFLSLAYRYKAFKYETKGLKANIMRGIAKRHSLEYFLEKLDRLAQKYNGKETHYVWYHVFTYVPYAKLEREVFAKSIPMQFENRKYPAPVGYDKRLRMAYGDYMQLPPKEKQVKTHSFRAYWR